MFSVNCLLCLWVYQHFIGSLPVHILFVQHLCLDLIHPPDLVCSHGRRCHPTKACGFTLNVIAREYLPIWRMSYCDTYHTLYRWIKLPNKKRKTLLNITLILCPETLDHDYPFLSVFIDILCWRDLVFRGLGSSINKCISVVFYVHSITAW